MKKYMFIGLILTALVASAAWAESRTITLSVPGMNCRMCPITVRKALEKVEGVEQAQVDYDNKTATVIYDDEKADAMKLTQATKDTGYPSKVVMEEKP